MIIAEHKNYKLLESIIDDLHPEYEPTSDELTIFETGATILNKRFFRKKGMDDTHLDFPMAWMVYKGEPETVRTIFEVYPAEYA